MTYTPKISEEFLTAFGRLVLFSYDETSVAGPVKPSENVQMLAVDGRALWKINGMAEGHFGWNPDRVETFVALHSSDGNYYANTFSGHIFSINIETGRATYNGFGK